MTRDIHILKSFSLDVNFPEDEDLDIYIDWHAAILTLVVHDDALYFAFLRATAIAPIRTMLFNLMAFVDKHGLGEVVTAWDEGEPERAL